MVFCLVVQNVILPDGEFHWVFVSKEFGRNEKNSMAPMRERKGNEGEVKRVCSLFKRNYFSLHIKKCHRYYF